MLIDLESVKEFLPHREPFLFVDEVKGITLREGISTENLTVKDIVGAQIEASFYTREDHPIFAGHFPGNPILPGVVQIEMMAQASSFALMKAFPNWRDLKMEVMLLGVTSAKFRKPIATHQLNHIP
jgi:3-hydroxyacyl-[acyl-carrier-protein] dehydratase